LLASAISRGHDRQAWPPAAAIRDQALLGAYQAAIDRLDAFAYRLSEAGATPARPACSIAALASPQRNLPLGPVLVARKPRRR